MASETAALVVERGTRVEGRVHGAGNAEVRGRLKGEVRLEHHLWVGEDGALEGEARVGRATIDGQARGRWQVDGLLEVRGGAHVEADVAAPEVVLSPEATFDGTIDMPMSLPADLLGAGP